MIQRSVLPPIRRFKNSSSLIWPTDNDQKAVGRTTARGYGHLPKSIPFRFSPALQLDPIHAKPLAEAWNTPFYERSNRSQPEKMNHSIVDGLALMLLRAEMW